MRAKKEDIPLLVQDGQSYGRYMPWGEMDVAWEFWQAGRDTTAVFRGLPDDSCPVPHWGYMIKGRMRIKYGDHDEVISSGEAFYMQPGHNTATEEDCELVWFGPKGETKKVMEVAARNKEALKKKG